MVLRQRQTARDRMLANPEVVEHAWSTANCSVAARTNPYEQARIDFLTVIVTYPALSILLCGKAVP